MNWTVVEAMYMVVYLFFHFYQRFVQSDLIKAAFLSRVLIHEWESLNPPFKSL